MKNNIYTALATLSIASIISATEVLAIDNDNDNESLVEKQSYGISEYSTNYSNNLASINLGVFSVNPDENKSIEQQSPIVVWGNLEKRIRTDNNATRKELLEEFTYIMPKVHDYILGKYDKDKFIQQNYVFPILDYNIKNVGGHGRGFKSKGFDLFQGNKHISHPAHDIFLHDKNYDCINDYTNKEFIAVAMANSVVLSTYVDWKPGSELRGGNCLWLFNPVQNRLFYYAHLDKIYVKPGEYVSQGIKIGTIGRTGKNAYKKRSPTHLHLMVLDVVYNSSNPVVPYNYFSSLKSTIPEKKSAITNTKSPRYSKQVKKHKHKHL